jgi:O-antigen/teichoic acid export membrane protein
MNRVEGGATSHRIARAMAWTVVSRAGRMALGFATSVMVVRGLGQHDYGVLSVVRSVLMFAVLLAGLGTGQALLSSSRPPCRGLGG